MTTEFEVVLMFMGSPVQSNMCVREKADKFFLAYCRLIALEPEDIPKYKVYLTKTQMSITFTYPDFDHYAVMILGPVTDALANGIQEALEKHYKVDVEIENKEAVQIPPDGQKVYVGLR